jgi:hypothetical protein
MQNEQMNPQQMQNRQPVMQEPPHVITTKDMAYINDMLAWNLLAMKKAHFFAQQCQNAEVKTELDQCGQMHQRHYQMLMAHLEEKQQNNQIM